MVRMGIYITERQVDYVKHYAELLNLTDAEVIRRMLDEYIATHNPDGSIKV